VADLYAVVSGLGLAFGFATSLAAPE
jgi:hypothetical protein